MSPVVYSFYSLIFQFFFQIVFVWECVRSRVCACMRESTLGIEFWYSRTEESTPKPCALSRLCPYCSYIIWLKGKTGNGKDRCLLLSVKRTVGNSWPQTTCLCVFNSIHWFPEESNLVRVCVCLTPSCLWHCSGFWDSIKVPLVSLNVIRIRLYIIDIYTIISQMCFF